VDQGAARGFDDPNTVTSRFLVRIENVIAEDIRVVKQHPDTFSGEQGFDHAGVVIIKRVLNRRAVINRLKDLQFFVCHRGFNVLDHV